MRPAGRGEEVPNAGEEGEVAAGPGVGAGVKLWGLRCQGEGRGASQVTVKNNLTVSQTIE